ncbi:uclacyanin 1 [Euphorbia peplus]|nr:uclacyanin 1 [Euphorbia peplus]
MARIFSIAFLATIIVAAMIQSSAAQTSHTVGGASGWMIPSTPTLYSAWAANQTFANGDVLVFNFATNQHDVTKVNKADYDACTTTNAITRVTTSPASITINGTGAHYFICGFTGHCGAGQKLTITVSAATVAPAPQPPTSASPAPQPAAVPVPVPAPAATPTPVSAPTPASSSPDSAPTPSGVPSAPSPTTPSPEGSTTLPPTTSTTPPPSDSSARSLGVAGLSATFLYGVAVFFF